jgi:hypothetical protein
MKDLLLNGEIIEFNNADHLLEFRFSTSTKKFHIIFNAKNIYSSKTFGRAENKLNNLIEKYKLSKLECMGSFDENGDTI